MSRRTTVAHPNRGGGVNPLHLASRTVSAFLPSPPTGVDGGLDDVLGLMVDFVEKRSTSCSSSSEDGMEREDLEEGRVVDLLIRLDCSMLFSFR